jgi:hypothetical protein
LVALQAQQEGQGALRRLIAAISAAGMQPVIVEPFTALEQTLRRWGWKERRAGRGDLAHTIWHPRETLEKPCLSGSIR